MENTLISTLHCAEVARELVKTTTKSADVRDESVTPLSTAACAALAHASQAYLTIYDDGRESQSAQAVPDFLAVLAAFAPFTNVRR
jgi:deoxyxylulose-5-phosphate synthase